MLAPMVTGDPLAIVVAEFVDRVDAALVAATAGVTGVNAEHFPGDVGREAYAICLAMVDSDARHSDDELWPVITTFAPLLDDEALSKVTPSQLRNSDLLRGKASFLDRPSDLFEILLAADRRNKTVGAATYYQAAMNLVHTMAALDVVATEGELAAISRYRQMLLTRIAETGVPVDFEPPRHPGRAGAPTPPSPSGAVPAGPSATGVPAPTVTPNEPTEPPRSLEDLFGELDGLVGLDAVKAEVRKVADLIQVQQLRRRHNLPVIERSNHLIFAGNPGTGKTTVARLVAQIFRTLGVVARGQLVEVDRSSLVAGFVGQTAPMVATQFDAADEGILFIDEAYSLVRGGGNDFGKEAIDAIVKNVEDRRDRVVVIMAGYTAEMGELLDANPGLRSRFPKTLFFADYSTDELIEILLGVAAKNGYELTTDAVQAVRQTLDAIPRDRHFGNGRLARNLFEEAVVRQASRVVAIPDVTTEQLRTIEVADVPKDAPGHSPETHLGDGLARDGRLVEAETP